MLINEHGFAEITTGTGKWKIRWTGWKDSVMNIDLVGQWLALPVNERGDRDDSRLPYYSSTCGDASQFHRGDRFDLGWRKDQYMITVTSSETEKAMERDRALGKLMGLIGAVEEVTCY